MIIKSKLNKLKGGTGEDIDLDNQPMLSPTDTLLSQDSLTLSHDSSIFGTLENDPADKQGDELETTLRSPAQMIDALPADKPPTGQPSSESYAISLDKRRGNNITSDAHIKTTLSIPKTDTATAIKEDTYNNAKVNTAAENVQRATKKAKSDAEEAKSTAEEARKLLDNIDNIDNIDVNTYAEKITQQLKIANKKIEEAINCFEYAFSQYKIIKNIYDSYIDATSRTNGMRQTGGTSGTNWSNLLDKYKSTEEAIKDAQESNNSAEKAVTDVEDNYNKIKQTMPGLHPLPAIPPLTQPLQNSSETESHVSEISEFNNHLTNLGDALGIEGENKDNLFNKLKQFNNKSQYKLINDTKDIIKELVRADEEIKKFTNENTNLDMLELNNQLAELQILALLQKTDNSKEFTDELVNLLKEKMKTVNEMLTHNLRDIDTTQQGGSSRNIYMNKYIKYKNKYLYLKKIKYTLNN